MFEKNKNYVVPFDSHEDQAQSAFWLYGTPVIYIYTYFFLLTNREKTIQKMI